MSVSHANIRNDKELNALLDHVSHGPSPVVDRVKVLLSFRAGLRAQEIAGLSWQRNVLGPTGQFRSQRMLTPGEGKRRAKTWDAPILFIGSNIGKYGRERDIPLHSQLQQALTALLDLRTGKVSPRNADEVLLVERLNNTSLVIPPGRNGASEAIGARANAMAVWFKRLYRSVNYDLCSSHSGRRTFITHSARVANLHGCSLVDVQVLAGHAHLNTTQRYVGLSDKQARMVEAMGRGFS